MKTLLPSSLRAYAPESANTATQHVSHVETIDYRRADGRFFCCPRATGQFWTAFSFPAVKYRLETGKKLKLACNFNSGPPESYWWSVFSNRSTTETLQPDLGFDNSKHHPEHDILEWISCLNGSFFSGDDQEIWDILKEEVKIYLPVSALNLPTLFLTAHLYYNSICVKTVQYFKFGSISQERRLSELKSIVEIYYKVIMRVDHSIQYISVTIRQVGINSSYTYL